MRRGKLSRCCVTLRIALRGFWRHLSYCLLALTRPLERSAVKRRAGQIASPMTGPRPRPVGQRSDLLLTPWEPALDGKISFVARYSQSGRSEPVARQHLHEPIPEALASKRMG